MKKKIDERLEQELFKCDHVAFRIMFCVSVIVILIQLLFMHATFQQIFGENVILLCGGVWVIWGYIKNGLWSRNYDNEPSVQSNLMYSIIYSLVATLLFGIFIYIKVGSAVIKATTIGGFMGGIFILAFAVLTALGGLAKNKMRKMENEYKDI